MCPIPRYTYPTPKLSPPIPPLQIKGFKMAPATRLCLLPLRPITSAARGTTRVAATTKVTTRSIHANPAQSAKVVPVYGTGPPPEPPQPSAEFAAEVRNERLARRKRQAEMLREAGDIKAMRKEQQAQQQKQQEYGVKPAGVLKRRFWKDVHVKKVDGALEIHLDARPLRHPTTKTIIRLPTTKPHLAHAIALEWDNLTSAQQATKQHLIPLTSLTCRALDIAASPTPALRHEITTSLLRYLDTDSLLCFHPPPSDQDQDQDDPSTTTLHTAQQTAYLSTTTFLMTHLWPGQQIHPVLTDGSLLPRPQAPGTREVVQGWILSLSAFELAALERATLAGKSLLAAARLVAEWSEEGAQAAIPVSVQGGEDEEGGRERFGVEEAARAVSLEVEWQTKKWGEVEDTHDVEKEDLRRQLGSAVLLVSGTGNGTGSKSG
ncbi:hypothetical protein F5144DRAFT_579148 [Chaetomium tenue]|uniref:Uncharacterized protein n=1 Tax=Chaetomium tenue TaxID=1854479 RepID=A0ACB7P849_9PEZI|nr:hypothetical protein F5144DRAFT_579148 [Chaetomium globosum]